MLALFLVQQYADRVFRSWRRLILRPHCSHRSHHLNSLRSTDPEADHLDQVLHPAVPPAAERQLQRILDSVVLLRQQHREDRSTLPLLESEHVKLDRCAAY